MTAPSVAHALMVSPSDGHSVLMYVIAPSGSVFDSLKDTSYSSKLHS